MSNHVRFWRTPLLPLDRTSFLNDPLHNYTKFAACGQSPPTRKNFRRTLSATNNEHCLWRTMSAADIICGGHWWTLSAVDIVRGGLFLPSGVHGGLSAGPRMSAADLFVGESFFGGARRGSDRKLSEIVRSDVDPRRTRSANFCAIYHILIYYILIYVML